MYPVLFQGALMFTQPNFFFIGGMRCGSTSLNLMLEQHPEIYMSPVKEPYYYVAEAYRNIENASLEFKNYLNTYEKRGKYRTNETYQSLFQDVNGAKIVGESSHYIYHPIAASAIFKHCPESRILVCLRNPIDRLFSEYLLLLRGKPETGSFSDYVTHHAKDYLNGDVPDKINVRKLNKGLQAEWLSPWFTKFGEDQVKLVLFDDLNLAPREIMMDVFRWLEVDDSFTIQKVHAQKGGAAKGKWVIDTMHSQMGLVRGIKSLIPKSTKERIRSLVFSKTLERPQIDLEMKSFLTQFYKDDIEKLSDIVGRDLSAWFKLSSIPENPSGR